jgi:hypothetical protein
MSNSIHERDLQQRVSRLINTSVDDCKVSLTFVTDPNVLNAALDHAIELGQVSRVRAINARMRQLTRPATVKRVEARQGNGR